MPSGSSVHIVIPGSPSFPSVSCVWLKILRGDVVLDDHFLMTIWAISELDTLDPGINNFCCSVFASSLRSAIFTLSFAFFRIVLLTQVLRICIYPQTSQEWIDQSMPHSFSTPKVLSKEVGIRLILTFHM